jgi:hypothetical protein
MTSRYILAPEAAQDLVEIWRFIKQQSNEATADRWSLRSGSGLRFWQPTQVLDTGEGISPAST